MRLAAAPRFPPQTGLLHRVLAAAVPVIALAVATPVGAKDDWRRELRVLGYTSRYLSALNLIVRLNLTSRQARKLYRSAAELEAAAPPRPTGREPLPQDLARVRADWTALGDALLAGEPVSAGLRQRVRAAQRKERTFVWSTLRKKPTPARQPCLSCHRPPRRSGDGEEPAEVHLEVQRAADGVHFQAVFGIDGRLRLLRLAGAVSGVLTGRQRALVAGFLGDLLPPSAETTTRPAGEPEALELMSQCRRCPTEQWPATLQEILTRADRFSSVLAGDATSPRRAAARQSLSRLLTQVRQLRDDEFDHGKAKLAKAVAQAMAPTPGEVRLKAAYYLLFPGVSQVYAALLHRWQKQTEQSGGTRSLDAGKPPMWQQEPELFPPSTRRGVARSMIGGEGDRRSGPRCRHVAGDGRQDQEREAGLVGGQGGGGKGSVTSAGGEHVG